MSVIERLRRLVRAGRYRLTLHARQEMDDESISTAELRGAFLGANAEVIEDYPNDPRGHSHLVLGFAAGRTPLHVCCAIHEECVVIITAYRPGRAYWAEDWRTRT